MLSQVTPLYLVESTNGVIGGLGVLFSSKCLPTVSLEKNCLQL